MNIASLLQNTAAQHGGRDALFAFRKYTGSGVTGSGLEGKAARIAAQLQQAGLKQGDAVLVFYPMSVELYAVLVAIFQLGLVAMFLDPSAGKEHIERCCEIHPPQALIASPKAHLLRLVSSALRRVRHKFVIGFPLPGAKLLQWKLPEWAELSLFLGQWIGWKIRPEISIRLAPKNEAQAIRWAARKNAKQQAKQKAKFGLVPGEKAPIVAVEDTHPALLTFTSGSTGQPKAALRTHGFLLAQHRVLQQNLGLTPGDIDLTTLPIFVLANLASGVFSVIPGPDLRFPGIIDPVPVVRRIQAMKPISTAASPAFLERVADYCLQQGIHLLSFQKIFTGGAPVFPRLLDKLQRIAPHAKIVAVYGSTEAEPIAEITRDEITDADWQAMREGRGLLAGKPVPEIQLRIVRDQWGTPISTMAQAEFDQMDLSINEPGEIVVSGAHVLPGYLHGIGDEETKFRVDGQVWHRTGDAGYLDAMGRLWLLGRCSAKITDGRGTLYPFAVECAAMNFPTVRRAALATRNGQRILVLELESREQSVLTQIREVLTWAALDAVQVVKRIPVDKRHNAKVDYPALQKMLG
ncbi:MAG: AMP-binding protein [Acidobacteria bacterium]|nr:AMP-binding protein [Acidobacteriota bacterium]